MQGSKRRWLRGGVPFLSGAATVVAVMLILMVAGVLPVKTETRTVVQSEAAVAEATAETSEMPGAAEERGSLTAVQIYERYAPGLVELLPDFQPAGGFGPQGGGGQALGTGFVVSDKGHILTNAHVVSENGARADKVTVVFKDAGEQTARVEAAIVGVDDGSDVALLKVDPSQVGELNVLQLGDSEKVKVGEPVVAIGNPLGFDLSLTEGIVSAVDRSLQSPNGMVISNGIQTDAAINSGNSGGPLIDSSGKVIGINEQIASQSGGNEGLGFAVPINTAVDVMEELKADGQVTYAWLGIQGQTISADVAEALGLQATDGVLVVDVTADSPASRAGLRAGQQQAELQGEVYVIGGDVITAFDGESVSSMDELVGLIGAKDPGDTVEVTVLRGGQTMDLEATLSERPAGL